MKIARDRLLGALVLAVAVGSWLTMSGVLPGVFFLLFLSVGFLGTYGLMGARQNYENVGFLIPGLVLLAIGVYGFVNEYVVAEVASPAIFFLLLAGAFLGVGWLHTRSFVKADHGSRWWPFYPAMGLGLLSLIMAGEARGWMIGSAHGLINYLGIAALLALGLWLLIKRPSNSSTHSHGH